MATAGMKVVEVVGLTFVPGYPDNLHRLHNSLQQYKPLEVRDTPAESFPVILKACPDNPHDSNAVEVHIPSLGDRVGHLSRKHAKILSPILQDRARWLTQAWVYKVRIDPEHPDKPGLDIAINRVTIEQNKTNQQKRIPR